MSNYLIITTAALPWRTGPSLNPLYQACVFSYGTNQVTFAIPWLEIDDQKKIYDQLFQTQQQQRDYILDYCQTNNIAYENLEVVFYPAYYSEFQRSIFPTSSIRSLFNASYNLAILHEPEHLFYYDLVPVLNKQCKILGILHTNYPEYIKQAIVDYTSQFPSPLREFLKLVGHSLRYAIQTKTIIFNWLSTSKTITINPIYKLTPFMTTLPLIGVLGSFFNQKPPFSKKAYYIGKIDRSKGLDQMIDYLEPGQSVDLYGNGEELAYFKDKAEKNSLSLNFKGVTTQPWHDLKDYRVFINCSHTEMMSTTTLEAFAMNKFVLLRDHPSNEYFYQFDNCLLFKDKASFQSQLKYALAHQPKIDHKTQRLHYFKKAINFKITLEQLLR